MITFIVVLIGIVGLGVVNTVHQCVLMNLKGRKKTKYTFLEKPF